MTQPEFREITDPDDDPTPAGWSDTDTAPGDDGTYRCEACGIPISTPSGRKPKVMLCEEHRANKAKTQDKIPTKSRSHPRIAEQMTAFHVMLGFLVGSVYIPTRDEVWLRDKEVITGNAETLGEAWAKVTDTNPKLRRKVEAFLESFGTISLAAAYAPVVIAMGNNHAQAANAAKAAKARTSSYQGPKGV